VIFANCVGPVAVRLACVSGFEDLDAGKPDCYVDNVDLYIRFGANQMNKYDFKE